MTGVDSPKQVLADQLRLGPGFGAADRERVLRGLSGLATHLAGWRPDQVELEIMIKDRGGPEQKVTLQAWLAGWPHFVATSYDRDLDRALVEVRKELIRQIEDERSRRDPRPRHKSSGRSLPT